MTRAEQTTILTRQRQRKNFFPHRPEGYLEGEAVGGAQPPQADLISPLMELDGELDAGEADDGHDEASRLVDVDVCLVENHPEGCERWLGETKGVQVHRSQSQPEIHEDPQ